MANQDALASFDFAAFFAAVDEARRQRNMGWYDLAGEVWERSARLNAERDDHPLCGGAVSRLGARGETSCQYALYLLRWLGRAPEEFLTGPAADVGDVRLPDPGPDSRLRWDLAQLHAALNAERQRQLLTWAALAAQLGCTPSLADQPAHRADGRHGPDHAGDPVAAQAGRGVHPSREQPAPSRTALGIGGGPAPMATVVAFHAHPDDEVLLTGGRAGCRAGGRAGRGGDGAARAGRPGCPAATRLPPGDPSPPP